MQIGYFTPVRLALAFLPGMRARHSGHIVNLRSPVPRAERGDQAAGLSAHAALSSFSRCLAAEMLHERVAVSAYELPREPARRGRGAVRRDRRASKARRGLARAGQRTPIGRATTPRTRMTHTLGGLDPHTPVIVGAGQIVQRPGDGDLDPIGLAVEAVRRAGDDSGTGDRLLRRADSLRHVATTCWTYRDEAALIAATLGIFPRETVRTTLLGGDGPQRLVGDTARSIANGQLDVAVVSGAEAVASVLALQRAGTRPSVGRAGRRRRADARARHRPRTNQRGGDGGRADGTDLQLRAARDGGPGEQRRRCPRPRRTWERCGRGSPRWPRPTRTRGCRRRRTATELIAPATSANRLVSTPYIKLLTANIEVDQAAALILWSAEAAEAAGVQRDRWVFACAAAYGARALVHLRARRAGGGACTRRRRAGGAAPRGCRDRRCRPDRPVLLLPVGGADRRRASSACPLDDPARPLTVTGGLTFAGGPGNNYTGHRSPRWSSGCAKPDAFGLTTAVGWYMTKHAVGVYSARPPARPFRDLDARRRSSTPRRAGPATTTPATRRSRPTPSPTSGMGRRRRRS